MSLQERALPSGDVLLSCPSPLDRGGLGHHLRELLDALGRRGEPYRCICQRGATPTAEPNCIELTPAAPVAALAPALRFSPAWRMWAASVAFDTQAARRLSPIEHLIAFNGTALAQFRAARGAGATLGLVAANSHYRNVKRQHAIAYRSYPIERPWITHLVKRNLAEYELAERIYVASEYIRESFIEQGIEESRLASFPLTPDPRYVPADPSPTPSETFDVLYVGSITVHKGVPLLIDAFRRLAHRDMRLVLVGGWGTRAMRRYVERTCAEDPRISAGPGDPLAHLQRARLYVHPAYEDGFAYAAAEALACGVPVLASADTGMKELIEPGSNGMVLPTGDRKALSSAIDAVYRGEILACK